MALPRFDYDHIPVTFGAFFHDRIRSWETLFPAEQGYMQRLSDLLRTIPAEAFTQMRELEVRMGVTAENWPRGTFTLAQVDFLNRNALYPEWRRVVSGIFETLDPILDNQIRAKGSPRLQVILAPADLPVGPDRMWTKFAGQGKRVALQLPSDAAGYVPALLDGLLQGCAEKHGKYSTWAVETGPTLYQRFAQSNATVLSYEKLAVYRQRLMGEVNALVEKKNIRGPRQLGEFLLTLRPEAAETDFSKDPIMSEFVRATLLAGNGTLLVNNTFVEWTSVQAVRRARPHMLVSSFGIRNKVKPFSSLLIYADQDEASAIPTQADMLGSYVDLEMLYLYVVQESSKYAEYRGNLATLLVAEGMDEMQLIAPQDFPLTGASPQSLAAINRSCREWLQLS